MRTSQPQMGEWMSPPAGRLGDMSPASTSTHPADTYEDILAALSPQERRLVHDVVVSGAIEGYTPDRESVARLADLASGKITGDQYRAELLASVRHHAQP